MSLATLFESFDTIPDPDSGPAPPGEEWLAGHAAGLAEGRAQAGAEQVALRAETAQAIADLGLAFAEAQALVLSQLAPLFATLAERIVPRILHETLGAALLDELTVAAQEIAGAPLTLRVAEADRPALEAVLPLIPGTRVEVVTDPRLGPGQALIAVGDTARSLDLDRLGRDISAAMAALSDLIQGQRQNG